MAHRNLSKPFSIAGFVLGEIYMVFALLGPSPSGESVPVAHLIGRALWGFLFMGMCGALVGMGIGLLVSAFLPKK
jgi:hypothetical protein